MRVGCDCNSKTLGCSWWTGSCEVSAVMDVGRGVGGTTMNVVRSAGGTTMDVLRSARDIVTTSYGQAANELFTKPLQALFADPAAQGNFMSKQPTPKLDLPIAPFAIGLGGIVLLLAMSRKKKRR